MKILILISFFLFSLSANASDLYYKSKCPKLEPMKEFSIDKLLGNWHLKMIYLSDGLLVTDACFNNNNSIENGKILRTDIEQLSADGETLKYSETQNIDPNRPGVYLTTEEKSLYGFFGNEYKKNITTESIVLYIDQELELRYACTQLDHFWYSEAEYYYYISVRNRTFDSISKLMPLFEIIKSIPEDLNKLQFLKNDHTCIN